MFVKVQEQGSFTRVTHSVRQADFSWSVSVDNHKIEPSDCLSFSHFPSQIEMNTLPGLLSRSLLEELNVCPGNPDPLFVAIVMAKQGKGKISQRQAVLHLM